MHPKHKYMKMVQLAVIYGISCRGAIMSDFMLFHVEMHLICPGAYLGGEFAEFTNQHAIYYYNEGTLVT